MRTKEYSKYRKQISHKAGQELYPISLSGGGRQCRAGVHCCLRCSWSVHSLPAGGGGQRVMLVSSGLIVSICQPSQPLRGCVCGHQWPRFPSFRTTVCCPLGSATLMRICPLLPKRDYTTKFVRGHLICLALIEQLFCVDCGLKGFVHVYMLFFISLLPLP